MINEPSGWLAVLCFSREEKEKLPKNCRSGFKQEHHFEKGEEKIISTIYTMQ